MLYDDPRFLKEKANKSITPRGLGSSNFQYNSKNFFLGKLFLQVRQNKSWQSYSIPVSEKFLGVG
jgi:hypothetical protein